MQQLNQSIPCVDIRNNPFYCPAVPAHNFIQSLRQKSENFRAKVHIYHNQQFVLEPFAAALDRCLFKGGGDSDDKRLGQFQDGGSEEDSTSSDDHGPNSGLPPFGSAFRVHTSSKYGLSTIAKGLNNVKSALSYSASRKDTGDSPGSDSFVTVPLVPADVGPTKKKYSALSGFETLRDHSGKPLVTTRRSRGVEPHTLTLWENLSLERKVDKECTYNLKRKSSDSDSTSDSSEVHTKRARSNLSVNDRSFYVTVRREKLRFVRTPSTSNSAPSSTRSETVEGYPARETSIEALRAGMQVSAPRFKKWSGYLGSLRDLGQDDLLELTETLRDELFGPYLGSEAEIQKLVDTIDSMLPGIRIKGRLTERLKNDASHQAIVNFLAENGKPYTYCHLNSRILELFRSSQVTRISLSESFTDTNGLNLISDDLFFAFSKPNSFRFLIALSLDGLCLKAPILSHIQHLPELAILSLFDTGIGNKAVYMLTPLMYTLRDLNIARNPAVDDGAVGALLMMSNLSNLSIAETSIEMPGARRLVKDRAAKGQQILVDFPHYCHEYIETLDSKFLVELPPPLISNPSLCSRLSVAALKRNLAAHAVVNRDVSTGGTKKEMVERLKMLLETRLADLEVRRMIQNAKR
ncbi:hypothetical protein AX15_004620 [Amanita polypyramis BW_CC]|nr:hypothetical protein AX15_004620 [Amanita polypyramis BW_CC]